MNDFDNGFMIGRFYMSWIINDDFFGIAIRTGKEYPDEDHEKSVYHLTIQLGYGQLSMGIVAE